MSEPDPGAPDADFELVEPMPWPLRLFLGAAGLACIGLSTWDLRHAILQPGWWTLLVGPILAGAWFVGGGSVAAALDSAARRKDAQMNAKPRRTGRRRRREGLLDMVTL